MFGKSSSKGLGGPLVPTHGREKAVVSTQPNSLHTTSTSRRSAEDPGSPNMEDTVIILPMLVDSVVGLGDLWDCSTNTSPGNIFGKSFEAKHLEAFPMQDMDYTLFKSKNTSDRLNTLQVSAELQLDLAMGTNTLKVSGEVNLDMKDAKKFNQEELICTYSKSTYVVRARPEAVELVDDIILKKITDRKIRATHYVKCVRVGGQASASIRVSQNIDDTNMDLSGNFNMELVIGPVNIKAKAEMKFLDKKYAKDYQTTVSVKARPALNSTPTTVAEMFEEIEGIDANVEVEKHFPTLPHVTGVPLSFTLVPISHLIDFEAEALYKMLSDDVMANFTSMIFTCQDFLQPSHIKGLLREGDPRLVTILRDPSNCYTKRVVKLEEKCMVKAKEVKSRAFSAFATYKSSVDGKVQDLQDVIDWYDDHFNVMKIYRIIRELAEEGKRELNGIHAADVVGLPAAPFFFSNREDLADWWTAERKIKLLLQTSTASTSPSGTFLRLFGLAGPLDKLDVEIGIAFPNTSNDFSLTFKIRDKEVVYKDKDIVFALEVLGVAVESGDMMSSLYYVLTAQLSGLNMASVAENLPDINSLVTIFQESRDMIICETYAQLLAKLTETLDCWNFVIPLQAVNSSLEAMKFFRQLRETLPLHFPKVNHRWLVGKFNAEAQDAPLLFVFRDQELRGVCLDHLDILILLNQLKLSPSAPDLSAISPRNLKLSCIYPARANFAIGIIEGLVLDHRTGLTQLLPPTLEAFPYEPPKEFKTALEVTRVCALRSQLTVLNTIAGLAHGDLPTIVDVLRKYNWTDDGGWTTLDPELVDWEKLAEELLGFSGGRLPYLSKVVGAIQALRQLTIPASDDVEEIQKLKDKIAALTEFLVMEAEGHGFHSHIYKAAGKEINESDKFENLRLVVASFRQTEVSVMWRGTLAAFEDFLQEELKAEPGAYFNLTQLQLLVGILAKGEEEGNSIGTLLQTLANTYCQPALANIKEEDYPGAAKKVQDALREGNLFKALGLLANLQQHHWVHTLTQVLYNLESLADIQPTKTILEFMGRSGFNSRQLEAFWLNPKFLFLVRAGMDNPALVKTLFIELVAPLDDNSIPSFIPPDIGERLKPLFYTMAEPVFPWPQEWADMAGAVEAFQILLARKAIPQEFSSVLRYAMETRPDLKKQFKDAGSLFFWDEAGEFFLHPWSLHTIEAARRLLTAANRPPKLPTSTGALGNWHPITKVPPAEPKSKPVVTSGAITAASTAATKPGGYAELEQFDPKTSLTLPVIDSWKRFTGKGSADKVVAAALLKIQRLEERPLVEYDELRKTLSTLLPFLVQRARSGNPGSFQASNTVDYIKYPPTDGRPRPGFIDFEAGKRGEEARFLMSKADLLTALLNLSDPLVIHTVLSSLLPAPMALPLLIPGIVDIPNGPGFKLLLPALQNLTAGELEGIVPDPHLLSSPFRLVLTLRVGDVGGRLGRSTLVNQLLLSHEHLFSCFAEPGVEHGKPLARPGLVEFTWLGPSKACQELWDGVLAPHYASNQPDLVLLGNVHGDALTLAPILDLLKTFTSSFLVFWKAANWTELKAKKAELTKILGGGGNGVLDLVLYPDQTIIDHVAEENIIRVGSEEEMKGSKVKLVGAMGEAVSFKPKTIAPLEVAPLGGSSEALATEPGILDFIRGKKTKSSGKFKLAEVEEDSIACEESQRLVQFIRYETVEKVKGLMVGNGTNPPVDEALLQTLAQLLLNLLALPIPRRIEAWTHFAFELDFLSRNSSYSAVQRLLKLRKELERAAEGGGLEASELLELQNEVKGVLARLELLTLSPGDIWRFLLGQKSLEEPLIGKYEEYAISGFPLQLFQSTWAADAVWEEALHGVIASFPPETRVFVVSTLGLKAGGKSTLLNHLFGPAFLVGAGGRTQGLEMRILWVEDALRKELKCDVFLVLDSEGLSAPENMVDEAADWNERNVATFVLGVSHLTLGVVLGEEMRELKDVLESAVTTSTVLTDLPLSPDVLLVQQKLGETKWREETSPLLEQEWSSFLQGVRTVTTQNEMDVGVRVRESLRTERLRSRTKHQELAHIIRPLAESAEVNALAYHADVRRLHSRILAACASSSQIPTLQNWYKGAQDYWETIQAIPRSNAPNNFSNAATLQAGIRLEEKTRGVHQAIHTAFRSHDLLHINPDFTKELDALLSGADEGAELLVDHDLFQLLDEVYKKLDNVVSSCMMGAEPDTPCPSCQAAFNAREALLLETSKGKRQFLTVDKMAAYMAKVRGSIWAKYKQRVIAKQVETGIIRSGQDKYDDLHCVWAELDSQHPENSATAWQKYTQYLSTRQTVIPAQHEIDEEFETDYAALPHLLPRISPDVSLPDLEQMKAFDLGHYNAALESALNSPKRETLGWERHDWLVAKILDLPQTLLTDNGVDTYLVGMVGELKVKVSQLLASLENICGERLAVEFKWEAHLYAAKVLREYMGKKQEEWDGTHNPLAQLRRRKEEGCQFSDLFRQLEL